MFILHFTHKINVNYHLITVLVSLALITATDRYCPW